MAHIGVINYGMGNLRSVQKGIEKVGHVAEIVDNGRDIFAFDGIILPGVGAFGDAMENIIGKGLRKPLLEYMESGSPFLGICLGMQLLLSASDEHGYHEGLDVIPGEVRRLPAYVKVPHMGWNVVNIKKDDPVFVNANDGSRFYFVHSYYCDPLDESAVIATTPYGLEFPSAIRWRNVWGVQFHPEKSSVLGLRMLKNFADVADSLVRGAK